jgi:hypothetical protein
LCFRELLEYGQNRQESNNGRYDFIHSPQTNRQLFAGTEPKPAVVFPPPATAPWIEQVKRLHLLLTVKESALDVLMNLEACRRIVFFTNSLFMDIPRMPTVRQMISFRYTVFWVLLLINKLTFSYYIQIKSLVQQCLKQSRTHTHTHI